MDWKRFALALAAPLGLAAAVSLPLASDAPGTHDGQVIAYDTGAPVTALVQAWTQNAQTGTQGSCPVFGEAIDTQRTGEQGRFRLNAGDAKTFTVAFCADGYFPAVLPDVPNDPGEDIVPRPFALMPSGAVDDATFEREVRNESLSAIYKLAYLRSVDPERFNHALEQLVGQIATANEERAKAISELAFITESWQVLRREE
jgi:hypothetical protein